MPISTAAKLLLFLSDSWPPAGVTDVLLYMAFTSSYSAPLTSPHTAALDGSSRSVGQLVLTQTDGEYSTASGNLVIPAQGTPAWGDQGFIGKTAAGAGFSRAAGLALIGGMNIASGNNIVLAFGDGTGTSYTDIADNRSSLYVWANGGTFAWLEPGAASGTIGKWATSTDYTLAVIARDTGYFLLVDGELLYIVDAGTAGTLYPTLINSAANATMPAVALYQLNTALPTVYPVPTVSDSFSDSGAPYLTDGVLINADTGQGADKTLLSGTWSSDGTVASNSPVAGAELLTNGDFTADSDWDKGTGWTIAAGVASKAAGTASILEATVDPLTTHKFYEVSFTVANRTAGTVTARGGASGSGVARSTNATFTETIFSDGAAFAMVADAAFDGDVDDVSAKLLTFSELTTKTSDELTYAYARSNVSIDNGYQSGVSVRDQVVRVNRDDAGGDSITVFDVDTMSASSLTGITYSDGATLEAAYRSDGKIWVHYNGAYVTRDAVTVDAASLQCGLFGTGSLSGESEAFECWPVDACTGLEGII